MKKTIISEETARAQVDLLFEAFELDTKDTERLAFVKKFTEYCQRGRLEISGSPDAVVVTQFLKKTVADQSQLTWNWNRLGLGKSRVRVGAEGVLPFSQAFTVAAPMIGYEVSEIQKMHPVDLSVLEDISTFFRNI